MTTEEKTVNATPMPPISVLICTRNRPDDIVLVMPHIMVQDYPNYEVIVIDQSSDDRSEELVTGRYGNDNRLRYIRPGTVGLSIARNQALKEARHELCVFTDDDVEVPTNWLTKISATFRQYPDTDVLYGPVHVPKDMHNRPDLHFACLYFDEARVLKKGEIFGMGANMALKKSFFNKVGLFDAMLGAGAPLPGSDEHDWLYRAHRINGVVRLDPANCIDHRAARTTEQWYRLNYLVAYGDAAFAMKHLRCGDINMLGVILHRLLKTSARTVVRLIRGGMWRMDKIYTWRYWLGIWGSLKYPIDHSTRLFLPKDADDKEPNKIKSAPSSSA